jgi:hypothetical protein
MNASKADLDKHPPAHVAGDTAHAKSTGQHVAALAHTEYSCQALLQQ